MTSHPDEGRIQAFLDRELNPRHRDEMEDHFAQCVTCREIKSAHEGAVSLAGETLALLDVAPSVDSALEVVHARVRGTRKRVWWGGSPLARAAAVTFLLLGTGVSALPGSPVREWFSSGWNRFANSTPELTVAPVLVGADAVTATSVEETGAGIPVGEEGAVLRILDLPSDAEVLVTLVDGDRAGIFGPVGTRFRTLSGEMEAVVSAGPVRVEIPRGPGLAQLWVNGEIFLRKNGDSLEILGPTQDRQGPEIRFQAASGTESGG